MTLIYLVITKKNHTDASKYLFKLECPNELFIKPNLESILTMYKLITSLKLILV